MTNIPDEKRRQRSSFWETGMQADMTRGMGTVKIAMSVLSRQLAHRSIIG
jgi:hypothetical protein